MHVLNTSMTQEQRIIKSRATLMRDPRFAGIAGVFMVGKTIVTTLAENPRVSTAATTGIDTYYCKEFVTPLTDAELNWLVSHEEFHKALRHRWVWKNLVKTYGPDLVNMAADYVINGMLDNVAGPGSKQRGSTLPVVMVMPKGGLLDHKFDGMDTQQVIKLLIQQNKSGGKGFDDHDFDAPAGDDGDRASGEKEAAAAEEAAEKAAEKAIDEAIRQSTYQAGKEHGNVPREFGDLTPSQVRWQDQLREFAQAHTSGKDCSTWRRPSRRWIGQDIYLPSQYSETIESILIAVDTSGSIGQAELTQALAEIAAVCEIGKPHVVHLLYWGTSVEGHETYRMGEYDNLRQVTKPKGGGGTDLTCVFKYIEKHRLNPSCMIVFTDGYVGDWPTPAPAIPALYCITTEIVAPYGTTIRVKS